MFIQKLKAPLVDTKSTEKFGKTAESDFIAEKRVALHVALNKQLISHIICHSQNFEEIVPWWLLTSSEQTINF